MTCFVILGRQVKQSKAAAKKRTKSTELQKSRVICSYVPYGTNCQSNEKVITQVRPPEPLVTVAANRAINRNSRGKGAEDEEQVVCGGETRQLMTAR